MAVMNWSPYFYRSRKLGRMRVSLRVYRHTYRTAPDRWVFQPELIWDRK